MCRHPLIPINAVPYPSKKSDVGMCLLKYVFCLSSADDATFSRSSFEKDRHKGGIADLPSLCISPAALSRLRLDVLKLVCEVTCKYQSVRKLEDNLTNHASQSKRNTSGSHHCDGDVDDVSIVSPSTSDLGESSQSDNSDSTFHLACDNDDEHNVSCRLYDVESSQDAPPKSNTRPLRNGGDSNGTTDATDACSAEDTNNDDDSSVEEMYSDFRKSGTGCGNDIDASDNLEDTDNLVCPGDVLEYFTIDGDQASRQNTVGTIIEGGSETCVVLKDGTLL